MSSEEKEYILDVLQELLGSSENRLNSAAQILQTTPKEAAETLRVLGLMKEVPEEAGGDFPL